MRRVGDEAEAGAGVGDGVEPVSGDGGETVEGVGGDGCCCAKAVGWGWGTSFTGEGKRVGTLRGGVGSSDALRLQAIGAAGQLTVEEVSGASGVVRLLR
eukprot:4737922-Pleurochrysis_carterae.AAC.1